MTHLQSLTDEELIQIARTKSEIEVTALELELARRLALALDDLSEITTKKDDDE